MIKSSKLKPVEIGFGESKVVFFMRMISVAEQDSIEMQFNDISDADTDRWQKEFEICRTALGEYSSEMPKRLEKEKGETLHVDLIENAESPTAAIDAFFKERTAENERVIRDAYQVFKRQLSPEYRFL